MNRGASLAAKDGPYQNIAAHAEARISTSALDAAHKKRLPGKKHLTAFLRMQRPTYSTCSPCKEMSSPSRSSSSVTRMPITRSMIFSST